ncbi:MAG: DUF4416 family protein [bacterium]|nr:DUF4416 family protein [bacterium]
MGKERNSLPVKLITAIYSNNLELFNVVEEKLAAEYGLIDLKSEIFDFTYTDYYEKEMGLGLKKKFISFEKLIDPVSLSDIKIFTNQIESKHLKDNKRIVNIDPGYLTLAKLVLASTKDFTHRIYIGKGIYAEVTLYYQDKNYRGWPWTYPDYKSDISLSFFQKVRSTYHNKISNIK